MKPADLIPLRDTVWRVCSDWNALRPNDPFRLLGVGRDRRAHFDRLAAEVDRILLPSDISRTERSIAIALAYLATPDLWPREATDPVLGEINALLDRLTPLCEAARIRRSTLASRCAQMTVAYLVGWRRDPFDRKSRGWGGVPERARRVFCDELLREFVDCGLNFLEGREAQNVDFLRKRADLLDALDHALRCAEAELRGVSSTPGLGAEARQDAEDQVAGRRLELLKELGRMEGGGWGEYEGPKARVVGFPSSQPREPWICRVYHFLCTRTALARCRCGKAFCGRYHHLDLWSPGPTLVKGEAAAAAAGPIPSLRRDSLVDPVVVALRLRDPANPVDGYLRDRLSSGTREELTAWEPETFSAANLDDPWSLAIELKVAPVPLSRHLRSRLSVGTISLLDQWKPTGKPGAELVRALVGDLRGILRGECLWDPRYFEPDLLRWDTKQRLERSGRERTAVFRLNLGLLEDAYPHCFSSSLPPGLEALMFADLQAIADGDLIWDEQRFAGIERSPETVRLLHSGPGPGDVRRLNQLLLADAFRGAIELDDRESLVDFLRQSVLGAKTVAAGALGRGLLLHCLAADFARRLVEVSPGRIEPLAVLQQTDLAVWDCPACPTRRRSRNLWVALCPGCGKRFERSAVKLHEGRAFFALFGHGGHFEKLPFHRCSGEECGNLFHKAFDTSRCPLSRHPSRPIPLSLGVYKPLHGLIDTRRAGGHSATAAADVDSFLPLSKRVENALAGLTTQGLPAWMIDVTRAVCDLPISPGDPPLVRDFFRGTPEQRWCVVVRVAPMFWPEGQVPFTPDEFERQWGVHGRTIAQLVGDELSPLEDPPAGPGRSSEDDV